MFTPMPIVIGTTDLVFALDSIPAIFGLTQSAYILFTANVFALMGLRQLYFLLRGLLNRLVYLSMELSVVLLWCLSLQQLVYRQLTYLVVVQSTIMALIGGRLSWHRMVRTGAAHAHATARV